jgi:hypothetical protein
MIDRTQFTILVTLIFIALTCVPAFRASNRRSKVYGGLAAQVFHFIGVSAYLGAIPGVILGSLLVGPLKLGLPIFFTCFLSSFAALIIFAAIERPARPVNLEDKGWTEQDARTSGL